MEVPGIEPGASCMLSTRSTTELHPRCGTPPVWAHLFQKHFHRSHLPAGRPEDTKL